MKSFNTPFLRGALSGKMCGVLFLGLVNFGNVCLRISCLSFLSPTAFKKSTFVVNIPTLFIIIKICAVCSCMCETLILWIGYSEIITTIWMYILPEFFFSYIKVYLYFDILKLI